MRGAAVKPWGLALIGLVAGVVAFIASFGGWHLYQDHVVFHNLINQLIAQQRPAPAPAPAPGVTEAPH